MTEFDNEGLLEERARNEFHVTLEYGYKPKLEEQSINGFFDKTTYEGQPALQVTLESDMAVNRQVGEYARDITRVSAMYLGLGEIKPLYTEWRTQIKENVFSMQSIFYWPRPGVGRVR